MMVARLHAARKFNQGYETVRYTASALVDMAVHSMESAEGPTSSPPSARCSSAGLPPGVGMNHRLPHFQHLFSGSQLRGRLLRLPVGRGARCRRLRRLRRGRRSVRPGGGAAPAAVHLLGRRFARAARPVVPSAAARPRSIRCCARRAGGRRPERRAQGTGEAPSSAPRKLAEVDPAWSSSRRSRPAARALDVLGHRVITDSATQGCPPSPAVRAGGAAPRSRRSRATACRPARIRAPAARATPSLPLPSLWMLRPERPRTISSTSITLTGLSSM